jgi:hypothetical protein
MAEAREIARQKNAPTHQASRCLIRLHEGLRASAAFFFDAPCFFFDQIFE